MNIFLIIVLLILVFCTINGWRKGLLGIVYGFVSWIFIFIFVIWSNPYIEDYLRNRTGVYDRVVESTQTYLVEKSQEINTGLDVNTEDTSTDLPSDTPEDTQESGQNIPGEELLKEIGMELPQTVAKICNDAIESAEGTAIEAATTALADFVIKGIAVLIAMLVAGIITRIVGYMIRLVGELPVINGINGFFGLAAGAMEGLLFVWILMYVIAWIATSDTGQILVGYIQENAFLTYLYQHNLIITLLENF